MTQAVTITYMESFFPGSFFAESTTIEAKSRDPKSAMKDLHKNAFAFSFFDLTTIVVNDEKLSGNPKNRSGRYYPGGKIWTTSELKKANKDRTLISNSESHGGKFVECNRGNWQPFKEGFDRII